MDTDAAYAGVYDVIYSDAAFVAAQVAFLATAFATVAGPLLDAGCGAGRHLVPLRQRGYQVWGLDRSAAMLAVVHGKLERAGVTAPLVRGDLRALPFTSAFGGALCLDSPLALLPDDAALAGALAGLRRSLCDDGVLVAEIYDYPASLGRGPVGPYVTRFQTAWGWVLVRESHRYDPRAGRWRMMQEFTTQRNGQQEHFTIEHPLRIRSADAYAAALEAAGFVIDELLTVYPGASNYADEQRMIFVAQAK